MNVFILGIQHGVQWRDGGCAPQKKRRYKKLLQRIVKTHRIEYIGEEARWSVPTFAKQFERRGILWKQIDMSPVMKAAIFTPTYDCPVPYQDDDDNPKVGIRDEGYVFEKDGVYMWFPKHATDIFRERHMFRRIVKTTGSRQSVLVIGGYAHILELEHKFRLGGHSVVWDALYKHAWFGVI
jgi:hypothetical protein